MKIHLVRHGETIANREKKYLGISHSPFTKQGVEKNKENIEKLSTIKYDAIYTSPSLRCKNIAEEVYKQKKDKLQVIEDKRLIEMNFGIFENMTWEETKEQYPEEYKKWCENPTSYKLSEGESQEEVEKRVEDFVNEIKYSRNKEVVVITHGGVIRTIIASVLQLEQEEKWKFKIQPGAIITIEIIENYAYLVL